MNFPLFFILLWLFFFGGDDSVNIQGKEPQPSQGLAGYKPLPFFQIDSSYADQYPQVQFDRNYFRFHSYSSQKWSDFYELMEKMVAYKRTKLNLYHIGGSHIQADIYTHDIREYLQTSWKNLKGERGWVFPFDLAGTNNPSNYEFTSKNKWSGYRCSVGSHSNQTFGALGAKITCPDSLLNVVFRYDRTEVRSRFNRIRIFHNKGVFPFQFKWVHNENLWWKQRTYEDLGYTEITFLEHLEFFELELERTTAGPFLVEIYGFQLLNNDPGPSYNTIGVNGAGLYSYLDCELFEEQLRTLPPDFFAFSVGTNDANVPQSDFDAQRYRDNLEKMMQIVWRVNPRCAILLTVPNDSYYRRKYLNHNIAKEREMIVSLAQQYEVPIWDFYGIMGELGSSASWYKAGLMRNDYIHFTGPGYHLKGELFIDAFKKYLKQFGDIKLKNLIENNGRN